MTLAADRLQKANQDIFVTFDPLQLLLLSGKGGVGKTTLACGIARQWATRFPQETILLLSTDPAHSLGDVLQIPVSDQATGLPDLPNLQVRALDTQNLLAHFKQSYGPVLSLLVERGSFIDVQDLSPLWDLNWPGVDELMGLLEIQRLLREQAADRIVVDMAPSGHTLHLFELMDFLDGLLEAFNLFQDKYRYLKTTLSGQYSSDEVDAFLATMQADLTAGRALLQMPEKTACWIVALPEPLSLQETRRFIQSLNRLQIPCGGILVNGYHGQENILPHFRALSSSVLISPKLATEPVGSTALDNLIRQLSPQVRSQEEITDLIIWPEKIPPSLPDFITAGRRLVIVGGKGGVGKTTVSAAIALRLAKDHPEANLRVVSIDPAHSLGDVLEQALEHSPTAILPNLSAQEVNAALVMNQFRDEYLWELADMIGGNDGNGEVQIAYGPQAWRQIVAQALPGIDEMLSLLTLMDLLERQEQSLIILDTAATGHLLHFLAMPTALDNWLAWILKLWLKYQDIAGHTQLMARLRQLRQRLLQAQANLQNPDYTEFIGVVQNQSAILAEAQRLTHQLNHLGIAQQHIVHNRYQDTAPLPGETFPNHTIIHLPELPSEVPPSAQARGAAKLLF